MHPAKMPKAGMVMTSFPYFVEPDDGLDKLEKLMEEHEIRHLPVQHQGKIVGIVSERDLHHRVMRDAPAAQKNQLRARDIMSVDPFLVSFSDPLKKVLEGLSERRIGSAVVVRRGRLAGVITAIDVCRIFAEYLNALYPESGTDSAA